MLLQTPFLASLGPRLTPVSLTVTIPDPCMWADIPAWLHPVPKDVLRAGLGLPQCPPSALPLAEMVGMAQDAKSFPALLAWTVPAVPKSQRAPVP